MGLANDEDPQGWKRPWGCGLGSRNRRGPVVPPTPVSEGREPHLGAQQASWVEWVGQTPSSPLLLLWSGVWEGPSCLPLLISLVFLLCPRTNVASGGQGRRGEGGALEGGGPAWELSRLPCPRGPDDRPLLLTRSSRRVPPTCLS